MKNMTYMSRLQKYAEEVLKLAGVAPLPSMGTPPSARLERYDLMLKVTRRLARIIAKEAAASLGARGGSKTSPDKARTAQENGARGGRPRKEQAPK